jgi:hypothetical protein
MPRKKKELSKKEALAKIEELKSYVEGLDTNKLWEPAKDDEYWYIDTENDICLDSNNLWDEDLARIEVGNAFETEEEAKRTLERLKFMRKFKEAIADMEVFTYGGEMNGDGSYIFYDKGHECWRAARCEYVQGPLGMYVFKRAVDAEAIIEEFGDELFMLDPLWDPKKEYGEKPSSEILNFGKWQFGMTMNPTHLGRCR